jgi:hypothetical protein
MRRLARRSLQTQSESAISSIKSPESRENRGFRQRWHRYLARAGQERAAPEPNRRKLGCKIASLGESSGPGALSRRLAACAVGSRPKPRSPTPRAASVISGCLVLRFFRPRVSAPSAVNPLPLNNRLRNLFRAFVLSFFRDLFRPSSVPLCPCGFCPLLAMLTTPPLTLVGQFALRRLPHR